MTAFANEAQALDALGVRPHRGTMDVAVTYYDLPPVPQYEVHPPDPPRLLPWADKYHPCFPLGGNNQDNFRLGTVVLASTSGGQVSIGDSLRQVRWYGNHRAIMGERVAIRRNSIYEGCYGYPERMIQGLPKSKEARIIAEAEYERAYAAWEAAVAVWLQQKREFDNVAQAEYRAQHGNTVIFSPITGQARWDVAVPMQDTRQVNAALYRATEALRAERVETSESIARAARWRELTYGD